MSRTPTTKTVCVTIPAALMALLSLAPRLPAQPAPRVYAITGAKVYTLSGPPLEAATVVIRDGKIAAVGERVEVPAGAQVIDAKGLEVYPGMFDAVTELGLAEVGAVAATVDTTELGSYNPELVAATAVHPASAHIPVNRAAGITHVIAAPGMGGGGFGGGLGGGGAVIGGQASAIHLSGWVIDEMLLRRSAAMVVNWPTLQTRTLDVSTSSFRQRPFREAKQEFDKKVAELGDWLERARHYAQAREKGSAAKFDRDLKLEALVPVIRGELPVLVVANRAREIRSAVEFCEKQKLKMILAGGAEAWKVKDLLREKKIPVVLRPTLRLPVEEDDPYDKVFTQPAELAAAGVKIAFASFGNEFVRRLPQEAGNAAAHGLPRDEAVKAITLYPAEIFGLADRLGSIEPGKIANLIVTRGDLLELNSDIRYLFINGQLTSTDNKHRQLYEEYRHRP